jgi:hypothetical protein
MEGTGIFFGTEGRNRMDKCRKEGWVADSGISHALYCPDRLGFLGTAWKATGFLYRRSPVEKSRLEPMR